MIWEHAAGIDNGPYGRTHGVAFIGNLGTLVVDRGGWEIIPEYDDEVPKTEVLPPQFVHGGDLDRHTVNFIQCLRTRHRPNADIEVGYRVAVNAHLGNIAFKLGRKLYWDADAEEFPGDEEANALLTVDRREPWSLPSF